MNVRARVVALVLAGAVGCAGAKDQDVLDTGSSGGFASSGGPSSSGGTTSGGTTSGGASSSGTNGTTVDGGASCTSEQEPNDGKDKANLLAPQRCGTIDSAGDVDFLTFTLKPTTQTLSLKYDGKVTLTVAVNGGQTVVLGGGGSQTVPFVRGRPYYVEIKAIDPTAKPAWRVDLIETP